MSARRLRLIAAGVIGAVGLLVIARLLVGPAAPPAPPSMSEGPRAAVRASGQGAQQAVAVAVLAAAARVARPERSAARRARVLLPACAGAGHVTFEVLVDDAAAWFGRCWARVPRVAP